MRVTSVRPDWFYDEAAECLYISNPIERYQAAVFFYSSYTDTKGLKPYGAEWVREYALEKSRYLLGDLWSKFSGAIPGPLQNLQLDQQKRQLANERLKELRDQLKGMMNSAPISIDLLVALLVPTAIVSGWLASITFMC